MTMDLIVYKYGLKYFRYFSPYIKYFVHYLFRTFFIIACFCNMYEFLKLSFKKCTLRYIIQFLFL